MHRRSDGLPHRKRVAITLFIDTSIPGGGGEPWVPQCRACKGSIAQGQPSAEVRFEKGEDARLRELNGLYHAACARPILSVKRAHDMMRRFGA